MLALFWQSAVHFYPILLFSIITVCIPNMNNKTKTPVFQTNTQKKFNQRHAGEISNKFNKKPPHFNENPKPLNSTSRSIPLEQQISQSTLRSASGKAGNVNVIVKHSVLNERTQEKKTGALSPRAPEKIKKNRAEEMKVYGENACFALFAKRPENIVRVWTTVEMAKKCGELFRYLAEQKKTYHVVDNKELALVSGTEHHAGICMLVKKARPFTLTGYLDIPRKQDCLVLLDGIQNPHNLGGIIRTCAIFGVNGVIIEKIFAENLNTGAALRIAEGGMEYVHKLESNDVETALQALRQAGYQIIHLTQNKQGIPLTKLTFAEKVVFVINEQGNAVLAQHNDTQVRLALTNPLKAELNSSVAMGILLAQWDCQLN